MTDQGMPHTPGDGVESALAGRGAGGSVGDWDAILGSHDRWLRGIVASRLGEGQAVEEVMQEVALAAVAQRAPILDPRRVVGWLYRLAVRQTLIYRRKAGRRRALMDRYRAEHQASRPDDPGRSPLGWILLDERRSLVQEALRRLPSRDADILVLKYAENWSARDLAGRLGLTIPAVEARLHRARGRLRAELGALAVEFSQDLDAGVADDGRA